VVGIDAAKAAGAAQRSNRARHQSAGIAAPIHGNLDLGHVQRLPGPDTALIEYIQDRIRHFQQPKRRRMGNGLGLQCHRPAWDGAMRDSPRRF
jgi:hypothetical protein